MDIIMSSKKPEIDIEYFGQQSRFYSFFEMIVDDLLHGKGVYAETNSGSNGNAYMFAKKGYKVITNDASEYSFSVANAIMSDNVPTDFSCKYKWLEQYSDSYIKRAAVFASIVDIYGYNAEIPIELDEKLKAFGFEVYSIGGHNYEEIENTLMKAKNSKKLCAIIANTIKGKGVSFMENKAGWHGKAPNDEQLKLALEELNSG